MISFFLFYYDLRHLQLLNVYIQNNNTTINNTKHTLIIIAQIDILIKKKIAGQIL